MSFSISEDYKGTVPMGSVLALLQCTEPSSSPCPQTLTLPKVVHLFAQCLSLEMKKRSTLTAKNMACFSAQIAKTIDHRIVSDDCSQSTFFIAIPRRFVL